MEIATKPIRPLGQRTSDLCWTDVFSKKIEGYDPERHRLLIYDGEQIVGQLSPNATTLYTPGGRQFGPALEVETLRRRVVAAFGGDPERLNRLYLRLVPRAAGSRL